MDLSYMKSGTVSVGNPETVSVKVCVKHFIENMIPQEGSEGHESGSIMQIFGSRFQI